MKSHLRKEIASLELGKVGVPWDFGGCRMMLCQFLAKPGIKETN
jgi:hypothetical protein